MTRDIQFRVFRGKNKRLYYDINVCFNDYGGTEVMFDDKYEERNDFIPNSKKPYIISQYTGLKDKNMVKIFEGDIVKIHAYGLQHITEVIFKKGMYGVQWKEYGDKDTFLTISGWFDDIEVIGNIYQNLELLDNRFENN